jgi:parvulin-like peptidyl-prolyl isomerase
LLIVRVIYHLILPFQQKESLLKKLVTLALSGALVLTACGGGANAVAATIDGQDITVGEIEELIDPGEEATVSKTDFAQMLGFEIQQRIVIDAAADELGITIADADIEAEATSIFEEANTQGMSREEFLSSNGVTEGLLQRVATQQLLDTAVRDHFTENAEPPSQEEIDARVAENEPLYCASHILVATEEEANTILDRLAAGEEFADVAAEVSIDTQSGIAGGDLGCADPAGYVTEFGEALAAAEVDVPTEPVETEFGFHVILLRADPPEAEVVEQLQAEAIGTNTNNWFLDKVGAAEVTVDERWGTWELDPTPQVVPPDE